MTMISKLTTAAGTTVTKSLTKGGAVQKAVEFSPTSTMRKMGMSKMTLESKDGVYGVTIKPTTPDGRLWIFPIGHRKEVTKALKEFIAEQRQFWEV